MNNSTSTPASTSTRQSALLSAPLDMDERLTAGDQYRTSATRKHRATRTRPWRTSDGQTHPVTISRKYA